MAERMATCRDGRPCLQEREWGRPCGRDVDGGRYDCDRRIPSPFDRPPDDGVVWVQADERLYTDRRWLA